MTARIAALAGYALVLVAVFLFVVQPVLSRPSRAPVTAAAPKAPSRPAGLPARIPAWALALDAWHAKPPAQRGRRPHGVPRPIPSWYWTWHTWRAQVRAAAQHG